MICHNEHRGAEPSTNIARVEDEEVAQQMYCVYDVRDLRLWLGLTCALAFTCQRRVPRLRVPTRDLPQVSQQAPTPRRSVRWRGQPTASRQPRCAYPSHVGADGDERLHMQQLDRCSIFTSAAQRRPGLVRLTHCQQTNRRRVIGPRGDNLGSACGLAHSPLPRHKLRSKC